MSVYAYLVVLGITSLTSQKVIPPEIFPTHAPTWINEGHSLHLTCVGETDVVWVGPHLQESLAFNNANVSEVASNVGRVSSLSVWRMGKEHSGRFSCVDRHKTAVNASIDIYVETRKTKRCTERPKLPSMKKILVRSRRYTVQCGHFLMYTCRDVELWKRGYGRVTIGKLISLKPGEGFEIEWPNEFFDGVFYCVSQYTVADGSSCKVVSREVRLYFHDTSYSEPSPPVILSSTNKVLAGQRVVLTCHVNVIKDRCAYLSWKLPPQISSGLLHVVSPSCDLDEDNRLRYSVTSSKLVVKRMPNVKVATFGCKVQYGGKWVRLAHTTVNVQQTSFVGLTSLTDDTVIKAGLERVVIGVFLQAFPAPSVMWYKDDTRITTQARPQVTQIWCNMHSHLTHRLLLDIQRPGRGDAGVYRVVVSSRDHTQQFSIRLLFVHLDKPVISTRPNNAGVVFWTGSSDPFEFTCGVSGYPEPRIAWRWQQCITSSCTFDSSSNWSLLDPRVGFNNLIHVKTKGNKLLVYTLKASGWFMCAANNTHKYLTSYPYQLIVSDTATGFEITSQHPPDSETSMRIKCKANVWMYRSAMIEASRGPGQPYESVVGQSLITTSHSHVASHTLDSASLTYPHTMYRCVAFNKTGLPQYVYLTTSRYMSTTVSPHAVLTESVGTVSGLEVTDISAISSIFLLCLLATLIIVSLSKHHSAVTMLKECKEILVNDPGSRSKSEPEKIPVRSYNTRYELPRQRLRVGKLLEKGQFGRLYLGLVLNPSNKGEAKHVGVKKITGCRDREVMLRLIHQLQTLCHVGQHDNIVSLVGAVTTNVHKGEIDIALEFCEYGTLQEHLVVHKRQFMAGINSDGSDDVVYQYFTENGGYINQNNVILGSPYSPKTLLAYTHQVCRAMEYLCKYHVNEVVVATEQVMLTRRNIVKVKDVGVDWRCKTKDNPWLKWEPVEHMSTYGKIIDKSLVWSFGVFAWEVFSLGNEPYPGESIDSELISRINTGYRMSIPPLSDGALYALMKSCWRHFPEDRPTFDKLGQQLSVMLEDSLTEGMTDFDDISLDSAMTSGEIST